MPIEIKNRFSGSIIFSRGDANLRGADLRGAYLGGVKTPPINDHYFASEVLFRASKTEIQKNFAARIRIETDKCWKDFFVLAKKMKVVSWAKKTLKWKEYQDKIKQIERQYRNCFEQLGG